MNATRPTASGRSDISLIKASQRSWAARRSITVDGDGYVLALNDNLFQPLSTCARREFEQGDGAELGDRNRRGKMQALHSSSALASNVFDYWRGRDTEPLATALGIRPHVCRIAFEEKLPTGVGPRSPNLDVVLDSADATLVGVESKFAEVYGNRKARGISEKYFAQGADRWSACGLRACQRLAESVRRGEATFTHTDVPQLLKHMLGLAKTRTRWSLVYLWYSTGSDYAQRHAVELQELQALVNEDGDRLSTMTYQDLFERLARSTVGHDEYLAYLRERYFPRVAT